LLQKLLPQPELIWQRLQPSTHWMYLFLLKISIWSN